MSSTKEPAPTGAPVLSQRRRVVTAAVIDVVVVLVFALIGRAAHKEGSTPDGVLVVALPFLVGLLVGWIASRAWLRPESPWPSGVVIVACTWAVGMGLRALTGAGTAASFLLVAAGFLVVLLLGWRAMASMLLRSQR